MKKILDLYRMFLDPLKTKTRASRKSDNTSETVAEHSWSAAVLTIELADLLCWSDNRTLSVLKRVLCHDIVEAFSGDFSAGMQNQYPKIKSMKNLVESETLDMIPVEAIKELAEVSKCEYDDFNLDVKLVDKLDWILQNLSVSDAVHTPLRSPVSAEFKVKTLKLLRMYGINNPEILTAVKEAPTIGEDRDE